jgi:hypothetical protein
MVNLNYEKLITSRLPVNYRGVEDVRDAGLTGKYVNQAFAQTTFPGQTLESEGFVQCSALIMQNTQTGQSYLAHIISHGLTDQQSGLLSELPSGRYSVRVIGGRCSLENGVSLLPVLNTFIRERRLDVQIEMLPDISFDSDRFSVSFSPAEGSVKLVNREKGEVVKISL